MPPPKMLLLQSSFSAWECHIYMKPPTGLNPPSPGGSAPVSPRNGLPEYIWPKVMSWSPGNLTGKGLPWSSAYSKGANGVVSTTPLPLWSTSRHPGILPADPR